MNLKPSIAAIAIFLVGCGGNGSSDTVSRATFTLLEVSTAGTIGPFGTNASGISDDGRTIVGSTQNDGIPLIWDRNGFVTALPGTITGANGVSPDGKTLLGSVGGQPASYRIGGETVIYPIPAGYVGGGAIDMGGNRVLVSGLGAVGSAPDFVSTTSAAIALPDTTTVVQATAISTDGQSAVGVSGGKPVLWRNLDAPTVTSLSESFGVASDLSKDGTVAVGNVVEGTVYMPFRWEALTGAVTLPLPLGCQCGFANAVSGNGSVVIGTAFEGTVLEGPSHPFIWTAATGTRRIEDLVEFDAGVYNGLTNVRVGCMSKDGKTIIGTGNAGFSIRGFVIRLP